jgi:hypothetical protein
LCQNGAKYETFTFIENYLNYLIYLIKKLEIIRCLINLNPSLLGTNDGLGGPRFHGSVPYKLKEKWPPILKHNIEEECEEDDEAVEDRVNDVVDTAPEWLQNVDFQVHLKKKSQK